MAMLGSVPHDIFLERQGIPQFYPVLVTGLCIFDWSMCMEMSAQHVRGTHFFFTLNRVSQDMNVLIPF